MVLAVVYLARIAFDTSADDMSFRHFSHVKPVVRIRSAYSSPSPPPNSSVRPAFYARKASGEATDRESDEDAQGETFGQKGDHSSA